MATPRTCSAGSKRGDRGGDCAVGFQIEANPIDDDAELLVTGGDASELYVLLWNRRDAAGSEMGRRTKPGFGSFAGRRIHPMLAARQETASRSFDPKRWEAVFA
jgi:hypothetical protein